MKHPRIVGFSASLRNARSREGAQELVADLYGLATQEALFEYLTRQGNLHLERYFRAGREKGVSYDELYRELRKMGGRHGLSNSEICLAAALWGAASVGAEVEQIPLADHFPADGGVRDLDLLKERLLAADGVIISTPVYFGDRSSLSQRFIDSIRLDPELRAGVDGKVYGGVAVGAKRNGGQETTIIYQLHDMMDLGFIGVGNDSETTSQYGGTGHAGDIATMPKDSYGLETCIGTGRRVARTSYYTLAPGQNSLVGPVRIGVWVLQDAGGRLRKTLTPFLDELPGEVEIEFLDMTNRHILPCLACDICPAHVGSDEKYRCVRGASDVMSALHGRLLDPDVIIPAAYSPRERQGLSTTYQLFLERTRYLRRGDYALSDRMVAPLVISEVGSNENLNLRMSTSLIRHHTLMHKSIMGWMHKGELLNPEDLRRGLESVIAKGRVITVGRLAMIRQGAPIVQYKPMGYILSLTKDNLPGTMDRRQQAVEQRMERLLEESVARLAPPTGGEGVSGSDANARRACSTDRG